MERGATGQRGAGKSHHEVIKAASGHNQNFHQEEHEEGREKGTFLSRDFTR
jgi:hypothetical protein